MKRAFLLMVVPALLVALGFAQTPAASMNTDQTKIKGCLAGSEGNYTVVEDNTDHIYKITTSSADLKPHVGHDVALIGHKASGASSAPADNSFAVTELNMISEHCAAAAAPVGSISTSAETTVAPAVAAAVPAATISAPAETGVTPAAAPAAPAATISTPAETTVTPPADAAAPAATVTTPAETAVMPAAAPAAPAATISTPAETTVTPAAAAVHPTRQSARSRRPSATPAAATTTPAVTADTSSETVSTPDAAATTPATTASTSAETVSTPAAVPTTPPAPARRGSLSLLIAFAVVVILLGILAPSLSRWRKRKSLERTGTPNLSFTREASSDKSKSDEAKPRKVA
jgi:DNA segregation ATPase FtsK/SpoIIIE, S-DNA-T family